MSQPHLPLFGILASLDASERDAAALTLIKALAVLQNSHVCDIDRSTLSGKDITEEKLNQLCHPDVIYALKRLVRGLPSDREAARQGFSLALTELLIGLDFLTVNIVLELLLRFTEITSSLKGKEERNQMFGRIFGFMSIVQSNMLSRPTTTDEDIKQIVDDLAQYSQDKSYLAECCHQVLVGMIPQIVNRPQSIKYIVHKLFSESGGVYTPDQLNVAITLKDQLDAVNKQLSKGDQINWMSVLGKPWKNAAILHPSNLKFLGLLLKESSSTDEGTQASATWRQHLHPVWDRVLAFYFDSSMPSASKAHIAAFNDFWNVVVDSTLFDPKSSHERRYWGFQLFEKVLPMLNKDQIPQVLTANFMRCFINNLSSEDRFLNKAAKHTMAAMHATANTNEAVRLTLITQLLEKSPNFDRISRSKTVETLLGGLDVSHIQSYLQYLTNAFLKQGDAVKSDEEDDASERNRRIDVNRQWVVDQMFTLFRNPKVPREEGWIKTILEFYLVHAFFNIKKVDSKSKYAEAQTALPSPPLSNFTRELCRTRFYSMMAEMSTMAPLTPKKDHEEAEAAAHGHSRKLNGTMLDGTFWCTYALHMMIDLQTKQTKTFECIVILEDEAAAAKKSALSLVGKIQEKAKKGSNKELKAQYKAFELLFVHMILQLYIEPADSTNILGELHECYDKVFASASRSKKANGKKAAAQDEDEEEEEEIQPVEVIIDILLSFLIKPSALLRHVSEQVFVIFCDKMTKTGLELMLSTLSTKDNKDDMFGEENDEEDGDEDEDKDESMDDEDEDEDEEDEDEEDEDEDAEDMDVDEDVDEELRKKVAEALGVKSTGSDDEEDEDEEEDLLDDDQMMAFDEKLNEIFRQKKLAKAQQKNAKLTLIHFKHKVLDLLDLYIKKQSRNALTLELIMPLLTLVLVPSSANKPIHDKISSILRNKLAKIKDYPHGEDVDDDHVFEILEQVHELAKKSPDAKFSSLCGELSLLLIKVLIGGQDEKTAVGDTKVEASAPPAGKTRKASKAAAAAAAAVDPEEAALKTKQDKIVGLYTDALKEFMTRKNSNLSAKLFLDFIERFPHLAWHMSKSLLEYTSPKAAVKSFRQVMAFNMLSALVKRLSNKRTPEFAPLFLETLPLIRASLIETLESEDGSVRKELTVPRLREVLKFATLSARMAKKSSEEGNEAIEVTKVWETEKLGPLLKRREYEAAAAAGSSKKKAHRSKKRKTSKKAEEEA
ncbi:DNA-directed DNA polymerase [Lunasporangiospora selenospora]|uniref:DNA-directed DNA polymerase n=1 Tax=Lunasporangiospora selenospora TaxID=979761 RepID=A0A9P6KEQ2_9FUNG|nr:DNA-directed DNA polymerase [Lunasporangiospora selenospora]